jgi:stage V sporulation protein B
LTRCSKEKKIYWRLILNKRLIDIQWSFLSLCAPAFTYFILRIIYGKFLGADGLGLYTLVFTIYLFGTQFAEFGIGAALTKYIAEYEGDHKRTKDLISVGLKSSVISGMLIGTILFSFSDLISFDLFHNPEMVSLLKIISLCFPFIAIQKAVLGTLNGFLKMKDFAFLSVVQNFLTLILSIFLVIYFKIGIIGAVFGFVIPTIIVGSLSLLFVKDHLLAYVSNSIEILKELLNFGFYVILSNSTILMFFQVDSLLIGYFIDETKVGYYAVAALIIQGIMILPNAIQRINVPTIANSYSNHEYSYIEKLIKEIVLKMFLITMILSTLLIIFGKFFISLLFTSEFLPAYLPLIILLIGYTIYAPLVSVGGTFSSIGKVKTEFQINAICALTNTVLNIILIPKFDIIGAALATSISTIIIAIIYGYSIKIYFRAHISQGSTRSLL